MVPIGVGHRNVWFVGRSVGHVLFECLSLNSKREMILNACNVCKQKVLMVWFVVAHEKNGISHIMQCDVHVEYGHMGRLLVQSTLPPKCTRAACYDQLIIFHFDWLATSEVSNYRSTEKLTVGKNHHLS